MNMPRYSVSGENNGAFSPGTRTKSGSLKIPKRIKIHSATGITSDFCPFFPFLFLGKKALKKILEQKNFMKNRRVDSDKESLAD